MSQAPVLTQSTTPDQLEVGDVIVYKGERAEVIDVKSWHDTWHGTVYGVDLLVKGKQVRASFIASGRVDLLR